MSKLAPLWATEMHISTVVQGAQAQSHTRENSRISASRRLGLLLRSWKRSVTSSESFRADLATLKVRALTSMRSRFLPAGTQEVQSGSER
jgi:hypothetical protein